LKALTAGPAEARPAGSRLAACDGDRRRPQPLRQSRCAGVASAGRRDRRPALDPRGRRISQNTSRPSLLGPGSGGGRARAGRNRPGRRGDRPGPGPLRGLAAREGSGTPRGGSAASPALPVVAGRRGLPAGPPGRSPDDPPPGRHASGVMKAASRRRLLCSPLPLRGHRWLRGGGSPRRPVRHPVRAGSRIPWPRGAVVIVTETAPVDVGGHTPSGTRRRASTRSGHL